MAQEFYGYFDSTVTDDRVYVADEFAQAFRMVRKAGVGRGLKASFAGGMVVEISPGAAQIYGYIYGLDDDGAGPKTFAIAQGGTAPRIDRVVLRLDLTSPARTISLAVKEGTPAVNPIPPALTNTDTIKEISLCRIMIAASATSLTEEAITDERLDPEVCGLMAPDELQPAHLDGKYTNTILADNLTTGEPGLAALDARQGKVLADAALPITNDEIDAILAL